MARKVITQELYEKLHQAYLIKPGNHRYASKMACCDPRTAKIGWVTGWKFKQMAPIQQLVATKNLQARAARQAALEAKAAADQERLDKARQDAILTETEEAEMTATMRKWLLLHTHGVVEQLTAITAAQVHELVVQQRAGTLKMSPREVSQLAGRVALMHRYAAETARVTMENERLRLGQPTHILGLTVEEITPEQAASDLREIMEEFLDGAPLASEVVQHMKHDAQDKVH